MQRWCRKQDCINTNEDEFSDSEPEETLRERGRGRVTEILYEEIEVLSMSVDQVINAKQCLMSREDVGWISMKEKRSPLPSWTLNQWNNLNYTGDIGSGVYMELSSSTNDHLSFNDKMFGNALINVLDCQICIFVTDSPQ